MQDKQTSVSQAPSLLFAVVEDDDGDDDGGATEAQMEDVFEIQEDAAAAAAAPIPSASSLMSTRALRKRSHPPAVTMLPISATAAASAATVSANRQWLPSSMRANPRVAIVGPAAAFVLLCCCLVLMIVLSTSVSIDVEVVHDLESEEDRAFLAQLNVDNTTDTHMERVSHTFRLPWSRAAPFLMSAGAKGTRMVEFPTDSDIIRDIVTPRLELAFTDDKTDSVPCIACPCVGIAMNCMMMRERNELWFNMNPVHVDDWGQTAFTEAYETPCTASHTNDEDDHAREVLTKRWDAFPVHVETLANREGSLRVLRGIEARCVQHTIDYHLKAELHL